MRASNIFALPNNGAQQVAGGDPWARAEIAGLKKIIGQQVWGDIQKLTTAISQLNQGTEIAFKQQANVIAQQNAGIVALARRIAQLEGILAQMVKERGGVVEHASEPEPGEVIDAPRTREAANARPGDETLPPEYFQGAVEEECP